MIGDGQNNLGFLYTDRLVELARSDAGQVQPVDANDVFGADQDLSALLPPQMHDGQAVLSVALSTNDAQNGLQDEILNYILTRAGVAQENVAPFRADIESIIMGKGNIFEKMFLNIKNQLAQIQGREVLKSPAERLSEDEIMREARDKALASLAQDYFNSLGEYHAQDSKYYFAENDLTKALSNDFLTRLYTTPVLATKMLESQNQKTLGQAEAMKAELLKFMPGAYYSESSFAKKPNDDKYFHDLAHVAEDFDLFIASPSIIDIANKKRKPEDKFTKPRASVVKTMQAGVEELAIFLEKLDIREKTQNEKSLLRDKWLIAEKYLCKVLGISDYPFHQNDNLNPVETVFHICQKAREHVVSLEKEKVLAKPVLDAKIKKLNEDIKARKMELSEVFKGKTKLVLTQAEQRPNLNVKQLKELNTAENKAYYVKMEEYYKSDQLFCALTQEKDAAANKLASFDMRINEVKENIAVYKDAFIKAYYPEVIPVANGLKNSYQTYCEAQEKIKTFVANGGTYSCLSFIPVIIKGKHGAQDRRECLVAMSGAEIESINAINAHSVLEAFANSSPACNGFTFRYVSASPVIDLLLKQVGKGLTGTPKPIAPPRTIDANSDKLSLVMPFYDKACAEKRLVSELIKLYKEHGEDVQVLGCDNIALPKASDLARQNELNPQPAAANAKAKEVKPKKQPAVAKANPMFKLGATIQALGANQAVVLEGEHITCCSSCQAQKPAVFTALYDAKQQHAIAQAKLANGANRVEMTDKNRQGVLVIN